MDESSEQRPAQTQHKQIVLEQPEKPYPPLAPGRYETHDEWKARKEQNYRIALELADLQGVSTQDEKTRASIIEDLKARGVNPDWYIPNVPKTVAHTYPQLVFFASRNLPRGETPEQRIYIEWAKGARIQAEKQISVFNHMIRFDAPPQATDELRQIWNPRVMNELDAKTRAIEKKGRSLVYDLRQSKDREEKRKLKEQLARELLKGIGQNLTRDPWKPK